MYIEEKYLLIFGVTVFGLRLMRGYSLLELEVYSEINEGDISRIENGRTNVTLLTIVKLAKGLKVEPALLMALVQ